LERGRFRVGRLQNANILWRLQHGELDGVNPKVIVLPAGTNNAATLSMSPVGFRQSY